jgi:hypothetical protein
VDATVNLKLFHRNYDGKLSSYIYKKGSGSFVLIDFSRLELPDSVSVSASSLLPTAPPPCGLSLPLDAHTRSSPRYSVLAETTDPQH